MENRHGDRQRHSTIAGVLFIRIGSKYQPLRHTPSTVSVFSPYPNPPPHASSCAFLLAASPQPLLAVLPLRLRLSESSAIHLFPLTFANNFRSYHMMREEILVKIAEIRRISVRKCSCSRHVSGSAVPFRDYHPSSSNGIVK